ncbi:MAG: hypothetical protein Q9168_000449 [Polycauliona sp. 1 TL-2023]
MQTIQEETEHTHPPRAASGEELTTSTPLVTDPSSSTHQTGASHPAISSSSVPPTQPSKPAPIIQNDIRETRPPHLRHFFTGPPTNFPPASSSSSSSAADTKTPPKRSNYDNQVPGIPTHWIPIYGAGHGLFYDPTHKLFHGDGPPRLDLERPDGSMPQMDTMEPLLPRFGEHREDCLHIQPRAVTDPLLRRTRTIPIVGSRYYCTCQHRWLLQRHNCPDERAPPNRSWSGGVPQRGRTVAIRPGDTIPATSFTHELAVADLGYLAPAPAQRYAYNDQMPISRAASAGARETRGNPRTSGSIKPTWASIARR